MLWENMMVREASCALQVRRKTAYFAITQIAAVILSGTSAAAQTQGGAITLTTLSPPVFPDSVNSAQVGGDVELKLSIRQDGGVASAAVVGRHERPVNAPFANWGLSQLEQSALTSAKQSRFDCGGCSLATTDYTLLYSFDPGPVLRGHCPSSDPMNPCGAILPEPGSFMRETT